MDYIQDIYVVRNKANGYYLNQYSLSTYQTYSKDFWCAMLFPDLKFTKTYYGNYEVVGTKLLH